MPNRENRDELVAAFKNAGCVDPEGWADPEIREDIPQFARYLLCKAIWKNSIESWRRENALDPYPEAQELLAAGADPEHLRQFAGKLA